MTLKNELKVNNHGKRIKIRAQKTKDGYSLYLDLHNKYRRQTKFLKLYLQDEKRLSKKSKETIILAVRIRDKQEIEFFKDETTLEFTNKASEVDFIEFFEDIKKTKGLPSYQGCLSHLIEFIEGELGQFYLPLSEITKQFCEEFRDYLLKKVAVNTVRTYIVVLSASLNIAVENGFLKSNPCRRVNVKREGSKRQFLTQQELTEFMKVGTRYKQIKNAFVFSAQTSLRLQDIRDLTFNDIQDGYLYFRARKNLDVNRLKLSETAQNIVLEQRSIVLNANNIFALPVSRSDLNRKLREIASEANISKRVSFHVARHTFACLCLAKGISIYTVSRLMGHSSVTVTEEYSKLVSKSRDEFADKINIEI